MPSTGPPVTAASSAGPPVETQPAATEPSTPAQPASTVTRPEAQTLLLSFVDASRPTAPEGGTEGAADRTLETTVYLPRFDGEPAPLIVLAHGFAGHPDKFTDLASAWSAAGFVVAVPKFPLTNDEVPMPFVGDLAQQGGDVCFVVDSMLRLDSRAGGAVSGRIDAEHIGLYGLSLGSLSVWGAMFDGCCDPTRIDAVIQSDGAFSMSPDRLGAISYPVMLAHSDVDEIFSYSAIRQQFDALPEPKYLLTMHGALHATVGENSETPADEAYRQATRVFWERHLGGRPQRPFPDSVFVDGVTTLEAVP